jgi:DNA-binding HxlR family transcriptional regulator
MPLRSDWSDKPCPIARGLDLLGDAWTLVILRELFVGNTRFEGLHSQLGAADKVLSSRLSRMVRLGLAERVPYSGSVRPRVEYRLTAAGRESPGGAARVGSVGRQTHRSTTWARPMVITCTGCGEQTV